MKQISKLKAREPRSSSVPITSEITAIKNFPNYFIERETQFPTWIQVRSSVETIFADEPRLPINVIKRGQRWEGMARSRRVGIFMKNIQKRMQRNE